MTSSSAIRFLYGLQLFGIKAGLENITRLLAVTGHPERSYPTIHIAGTNGKGSVSSMLAAMLTAAGYRTGLYTSPHLADFSERIRVDGKPIPLDAVVTLTRALEPVIRKTRATFFEATTAIAFEYFRDAGVDIAVIETGLGGRLDATNVVQPLVSVITNIGLDHMEYLGTTLHAIAREKGGIIKPGVPAVTGVRMKSVFHQLRAIARSRQAALHQSRDLVRAEILQRGLDGLLLSLTTPRHKLPEVMVELPGDHQAENVETALSAVELLPCGIRNRLTAGSMIRGLSEIRRLSGLRARLEILQKNPPVILDVAHNPHGMAAATASLGNVLPGRWLVVFGAMKDKDYGGMLEHLYGHSRLIIAVEPRTPRALGSREIIKFLHARGFKGVDGHTVDNGVRMGFAERRPGEPVLITGSHYVAGEALKFLNCAR